MNFWVLGVIIPRKGSVFSRFQLGHAFGMK